MRVQAMWKTATYWLTWIIFALTLIFMLCAFAAILNWFDRGIADMITRFSAYTIFTLGIGLLICIMLDRADD